MPDITPSQPPALSAAPRRGLLDLIERVGNWLPDPTLLFFYGALLVMVLSWALSPRFDASGALVLDDAGQPVQAGWSVQPKGFRARFEPVLDAAGQPLLHEGEPRVRVEHDADGKPILELTSDQRKVVAILQPKPHAASQPADPPASAPAAPDAAHPEPARHAHEPVRDEQGEPIYVLRGAASETPPLQARNLLSSDGLYWALSNMVKNFMEFPPLGIVLVGMLGIGVAEKSGMLGAALKAFVLVVPRLLLTPAMVFLGVMSSLGVDAGYIVLPPLAAVLYKSLGRSPLVGIAAVFAGVSAGFNANLFITGLDPMLAGLSTVGAAIIEPDYVVSPTCNWWFAIVSTFVITLTGWAVSAFLVEPRMNRRAPEDGGPQPPTDAERAAADGHSLVAGFGLFLLFVVYLAAAVGPLAAPQSPLFLFGPVYGWLAGASPQLAGLAQYAALTPEQPLWVCLLAPVLASVVLLPAWVCLLARGGMERADARALGWATAVQAAVIGGIVLLVVLPGSPLYGRDPSPPGFDRWVKVIVPLLFFGFILPGIAFGVVRGVIRSGRDFARLLNESIAGMAPIIVLAFFAAQFIKYFEYSNLDKMLAWTGGLFLADAQWSPMVLIVLFILVTAFFNLFVGSMSAKYTMFAPIFVPMLMIAGISPELTQAAYRVGDSVTNIITPLNSYLVILLVYMQRYVPKASMGTLIALMMPYTVAFLVVWTVLLLVWMSAGWELGLGGPLWYTPG